MKMKRTRRHNADGTTVFNTFNSTGLTPQYHNINARFNTKYGTKLQRTVANRNPGTGIKDSCTIAGCGKQCCTSTVLLSNISCVDWENESKFNLGYNLEPGHEVFVTNQPSPSSPNSIKSLGKLEDIVISNTSSCIAIGMNCQDCSGAFPLNIQLIVNSGPNGCQNINTFEYKYVWVSKLSYPQFFLSVSTENIITTKPGSGRVGAPYRAPIAGYRKSLDCCVTPSKNCSGNCYLKFGLHSFLPPGTSKVGDHVYKNNNEYLGEVVYVNLFPENSQYAAEIYVSPLFDPRSGYNCHAGITPFVPSTEYTLRNVLQEIYQKVHFIEVDKTQCITKPVPLNDVYKDPSVKSCGKDNRVCYNGRIRSGMQPKQQFCVKYTKVSANSYRKHKKLLCPTDVGWQKPYSFSYSQYNKNRALNTYKRGLEKNLRINNKPLSACPFGKACTSLNPYNNVKSCCQKSIYRKSSGNSCLGCVGTESCDEQLLIFFSPQDVFDNATRGAEIFVPGTVITNNNVPIGTVSSATYSVIGQEVYVLIKLNDCQDKSKIQNQEQLAAGATQLLWNPPPSSSTPLYFIVGLLNPIIETSKPPKHAITIWKPNNNKFKVQGAVTSGGRLERLKLDTIKAANSKCRKGQRCDKNDTGKGPYFAGKPRFDKWMFNGRHREIVCENKYRQQPFGIPQLTRRGRSTRSNKAPVSWQELKTERTKDPRQRYTVNPRAPGCACPEKRCKNNLCPGEGEMVLARNSNKYQPSRCRGASDVYLTTDEIIIPDTPSWLIAGKIPRIPRPGWQGPIQTWVGYNKFSWTFQSANGSIYGTANLPVGVTQTNNPPMYGSNEILFFVPAMAPNGGGGSAMVVEGTALAPNSVTFLGVNSPSPYTIGGPWTAIPDIIYDINAPLNPIAVTIFVNGMSTSNGTPNGSLTPSSLFPLSPGEQFSLTVN